MTFEICKQTIEGLFSGNITSVISQYPIASAFTGGILMGVLVAIGIMLALLVVFGLYVYTSLAWQKIAKKFKYKNSWLAWIPIVRWSMILQLGKFHWAWIFLIFLPVIGWIALLVLLIISKWKIFEKRKYPGWFSLVFVIPKIGSLLDLIIIGFVAWKDLKRKLFT